MADGFTIVADFNADPLGRFLRNRLGTEVEVAPYNQVYQALETAAGGHASLVWVRPESVLPGVAAALDLEAVDHQQCIDEVAVFAGFLKRFAARFRHCFVASFTLPPQRRGYGVLDWRPGLGLASLMARLNLELAEQLAEVPNVHLLDASRWLGATVPATSPKMWFAAKVPFATQVLEAAAADVEAAVLAVSGKSRRLVVVDLDNTMWGGVIGETGWRGIRLGGHDHIGEAFVAFQRALKALSNRGIQIALLSKNDEAVALEAFEHHPEMVLRTSDLAGWRIDWNDKAANIAALCEELNLGLGSAVFIDDNPHERERVRAALPEVLTPEWPADPCAFAQTLLAMDCFDSAVVSEEDRRRTSMYVADRDRKASRTAVPALGDWLQTLGVTVAMTPLGKENITRAAQLLNKTNQLNMATRRLTEAELADWAKGDGRSLHAISVRDKFGDMGLSGLIGVEVRDGQAELVDYVLSCRVMGRGVEETMFHIAASQAIQAGARTLTARFQPTDRNRPCLQVMQESALSQDEPNVFRWDCAKPYPLPGHVSLIAGAEAATAPA